MNVMFYKQFFHSINVLVDGQWGAWKDYGDCDSTCGRGIKQQKRICNYKGNGNKCNGETVERKAVKCFMDECPGMTIK